MNKLASVLFLSCLIIAVAPAEESLRQAEQALQAKDYGRAVELLDQSIDDGDSKEADYATYLKALASFHQGKDQVVVATCDTLIKDFKDSDWFRKALFLKSRALVRQKKFEEAEEIYEREAQRLFSSDRKEGLARILVEFADELSRKPEPSELDAPAPDFNQSHAAL